ncbi:nitrous oxide reductase accessory protein NosL [Colwellia sp. 12G3]|uniref:nitrous oxide reductase accessory protein NosL n=1 Tax=Colwellia sp. 12G3 TaxID=2058299 RepID=UPI000C3269E0|nr:nitrous oxide reductase accessory protein NosL [Colwellia sp. 12G3]PKI17725.1 nitrous oxide reductase accessory protein NosL [Colwellia sp. 12G3]
MSAIFKTLSLNICTIFCLVILSACSDNSAQQTVIHKAVAMESSDECHLCGMLITHFDGPKGEVFRKEQGDKVFKFCSTRDMFSYYLDPENTRNISQMLVHDMSKMPWGSNSIDDTYFIDAKNAWYVVGSEKTGAMGKTLASFSLQTDAQAFATEFGGTVLSFKEVNQDSLW